MVKKVIVFFLVAMCFPAITFSQCCYHKLIMLDSYGDGWNGGYLEVLVNGTPVGTFSGINYASTDSFQACTGDIISLQYTQGQYENENSYALYDHNWNLLFNNGPDPLPGNVFNGTAQCNSSSLPGNHPCTAIPIDTGMCVVYNNTSFGGSGLNPGCANIQGHDMWFTFITPPSGNILLETDSGTLNDTGIALWTDSLCNNPVLLQCDDDNGNGYYSRILAGDLTPGSRLYVQVWGYGGSTGDFRLCVSDLGFVTVDSTELPLVLINTLGQTIITETKINALMDIKYNGPGNMTYFNGPSNVYSGHIGIEIRGATSSGYPQKPYNVETRTSAGANLNVSLLGMPPENDWVFLSNYNDRSLIRNSLAFHLFEKMGNYAVRTRLCEVFVDSIYKGIYVFGEKIKPDSLRLNISKLSLTDTIGNNVTGGYILQQNYWDNNNSFLSAYSPIDHPGFDVHFVYEYPKPDDILPSQKSYIASYVDSLEDALYSASFDDPLSGYRKYLDTESFIDYFLINELARNNDGFKKSVFFHKNKHSKGGKLKAGPVWDFDWAWKNLYGCSIMENTSGEGWAHHINDCPTDNYSCGWYIRLLQDSTFTKELRCRYEYFRSNILDTSYIFSYIDSVKYLVQNAQERHFSKWPILGITGPAPEMGDIALTYNDETDTLKAWIVKRLNWLDANIPGLAQDCQFASVSSFYADKLKAYPIPADDFLNVKLIPKENKAIITLTDMTGHHVYELNSLSEQNILPVGQLQNGLYILKVQYPGRAPETQKIIISHQSTH